VSLRGRLAAGVSPTPLAQMGGGGALAIARINVGTTAVGAWAATATPAAQGSAGQGGNGFEPYDHPATGGWINLMHEKVTDRKLVGLLVWKNPLLTELQADDFSPNSGIDRVEANFSNHASWTELTYLGDVEHPEYGMSELHVGWVYASDGGASRAHEGRAIVYSKTGLPFVLQGIPDPATEGRVSLRTAMWSLILNLDSDSSLPNAQVHFDANAAGGGTGLSQGSPLNDWGDILDLIKAEHGTTDVGGADVWVATGNQHFGIAGAGLPIQDCATQYLNIRPEPGASPVFTTSEAEGLSIERLRFWDMASTASINNYDPGGIAADNYHNTSFVNHKHDGGIGNVDGDGQPNGPKLGNFGNGFFEFIGTAYDRTEAYIKNCSAPFIPVVTLIFNCEISNIGDTGADVLRNPKVGDNVVFSGFVQGPNANHMDAVQQYPAQVHAIRRDFVIEDWEGQGDFCSEANPQHVAIIRPRYTTPAPHACFAMNAGATNCGVYDPVFSGPTQSGVTAFTDCRSVHLATSEGGKFDDGSHGGQYNEGWSPIYHDSVVEPDVGDPPADYFSDTFGANYVSGFDAEVLSTYDVDVDGVTITTLRDVVGAAASTLDHALPLLDTTGMQSGRRTIEGNGDNSVASAGTSIRRNSNVTTGDVSVELFFAFIMREDPVADATTHYIFAYGDNATNVNVRKLLRTVTGSENKATWRIDADANTITAPGNMEQDEDCIVHCYYDAATREYGVAVYNAAQPTYDVSAYATATKGSASTTGTGSARRQWWGRLSAAGGAIPDRCEMGLNKYAAVNRTATALERAGAIAALRERTAFAL
jgi:hypothetical protein